MTTTNFRSTTTSTRLCLLALAVVWLVGCPSRDLKPLTPCVVSGVVANIQQNPADKIDALFVVDNSFSMDAEQRALSEEFQEMVRILVTGDTDNDGDQDNPPVTDLHLGVVTTDLGIGGMAVTTPLCGTGNRTPNVDPTLGDDGVLQTKGDTSDAACEDTYPAFLSFSCDDEECSTPTKETERDQLAQNFACVAKLGIGGCGLEQPLEAALKALSDPAAPEPVTFTSGQGRGGADDPFNVGFLRPDSLLAIILVTDEEDCSSPDPLMFESPQTFIGQDPPPVAEVPFRCADKEWGDAERLYPVERYVDGFLKLREGREQLLVFAAITGVPQTLVNANKSDQGNYDFDAILGDNEDTDHPLTQIQEESVCIFNPEQNNQSQQAVVRPSCGVWNASCDEDDGFQREDQFAFPPRRIVDVARGLSEPTGGNAVVQSICPPEGETEPDFAPALNEILNKIGDALMASTCLPRELRRNDSGEVNCSVIETLPVGITCDSQAGRTLRDTQDGQEICVVAQLPTSVDQTSIPDGEGWYYDDFTKTVDGVDSPRLKYCGEEGRRVAFTGAPAAGASVRLECTQPVKSASTNEPGSLGSDCSSDPNVCMEGMSCETNSNTCQFTCASNVDCSQKASSAYVCNPDSGFCITPTCQ